VRGATLYGCGVAQAYISRSLHAGALVLRRFPYLPFMRSSSQNSALSLRVLCIILCCLYVAPSVQAQERTDSLATRQDSASVARVTAVADSSMAPPDSVGAKEAHPQDSPVNRGFRIRTVDGNAELRIRGSVRLNGIVDFKGLQSQSTFNTYDIPVADANSNDMRYAMYAGQTRLGLEAIQKAGFGDIFTKVETDFLGLSNTLRLRHAYASVYRFLFGQTWSTFADLTAIPLTVDLDGPNGSVSERTVQIRYSNRFSDHLSWDASIESPNLEVTMPESLKTGTTFQSFPDVVGRIRESGGWGHFQLASVLRSIRTNVFGSSQGQVPRVGYGLLVSGRIYLGGETPHRILFELVAGKAVSRYIGTLARKGLDVVYDPVTGSVELIPTFGGYFSYARQWTPNLLTYVTAGFVRVGNVESQPPDAFRFSRYVSGNLFWDVAPGTRLGAEYSWGVRQNKDYAHGTASRISFILMYDF
jgi:hypothetical protein